MSGNSTTLAVFDLDGTITSKDTYLEFIKYSRGALRYYTGLIFLSPYIISYYLKILPNYKLKEKFFGFFFKGIKEPVLNEIGEKYSSVEIDKIIRKGAKEVLQWHKSQNHSILILSASSDIWLKKWCKINQFQLICTKFQVENGKYTGRLNGKNCFGEQKKILLQEYMATNRYSLSFGYGDSSADKYFLELVDYSYLMELDEAHVARHWKPELKS